MTRILALLLLAAAPAVAQDVRTSEAPGAILRWLDKMSGETADVELTAGQSAVSGHLTIRLDECRYPSADRASDAYAHLTIHDSRTTTPVFDGWMIASSPALSALDHPRYDVWILRCTTESGAGQ